MALCACLLLTGCTLVDADQDTLCRRVIPALVDASDGIRVLQSQGDGGAAVTVRFWLASDGRSHRLDCLFQGQGMDQNKRRLAGLRLDSQAIGPASLHYILTRWLETHHAVIETPAPAAGNALLPNVSPGVAYGLQHALASLPKLSIYALMAAAYALIYGLIGRINLVFGSLAALGGIVAVLAVMLVNTAGYPSIPHGILLALVVSALTAAGFGWALARNVIAPLMGRSGQQALIASLGLMVALDEFLRLAQGSNSLWLPPVFNAPVTIARSSLYDATVTPMAVATAAGGAAAALGLRAFLESSRFGREWRAVADEPDAAALFGISAIAVVIKASALAAALAAFSGFLVVSYYGGIGFAGGTMLGLIALTAAILGGIGSVTGAMLGGIVIALAEAAWSALFPIEHKDIAIFILLAVVLAFKPDGLFGGRLPGPVRV